MAVMRIQATRLICLSVLIYAGLIHADPVWADGSGCLVRDHNALVTVVICPAGLDQPDWREAGVEACGARKPCAAWIWDDPKKAPEITPPTPTDMSREEIVSAVAIWVNETSQLITISPVSE